MFNPFKELYGMEGDLYELHKAGIIDLMARSTVPEDKRDRQDREDEADSYALTYEEGRTLIWAYNIFDAVIMLNDFIETDKDTGEKVRVINADSTAKTLAAFVNYGLDPKNLFTLSERILAAAWYTVILPEGYSVKDKNSEYFTLITNIEGKRDRSRLRLEDYPAIYDGSKTELREALRLPQQRKFLYAEELDILDLLHTICNPNPTKGKKINFLAPIPNRIATPSTQLTEKLFTPDYLEYLPEEQNQYAEDANGQITLFKQSKSEIAELHAQVIGILFAIFINQYEEEDGTSEDGKNEPQTISFYAPDFCRKAGIDTRDYSTKRDKSASLKDLRWKAIYNKLKPLETVMGRSLDGVFYRLLLIESYDKDREIIKVRTPYLASIYKIVAAKTLEETHGQVNMLMSSTVVNEPNSAAFELANYLLNKLLQLGNYKKEGSDIVRYTVRYGTLISNCPQLYKALDKIQAEGSTQAYNAKLKQTFEAAYRIIFTKSDAQRYFTDLQINGVKSWETTTGRTGRRKPANFRIPTKTQLNDKLVITHKGKNPDYEKP